MPKRTDSANTPYYLLKCGDQAIYPTINFEGSDTHCVCFYGFSDKPIYDKFIKRSGQVLTPYPLVKGHLSNQIADTDSVDTTGDHLRLVILDATDPEQPFLSATTMATVLLAQQEKSNQVPIEFELVFDPKTTGYRLSDDSKDVPASSPFYIVQ